MEMLGKAVAAAAAQLEFWEAQRQLWQDRPPPQEQEPAAAAAAAKLL